MRFRRVVARDPFLIAVGRQIRSIRLESGLSQFDVEHRTGVRQHALSEIESGRRALNLRTLARLAKGLGVEPRELIPLLKS